MSIYKMKSTPKGLNLSSGRNVLQFYFQKKKTAAKKLTFILH